MGDYVKRTVHPRDKDLHALLTRLVRNTHTVPQPSPVTPVVQIDTNQIAEAVAKVVGDLVENNLKNVQVPVYNSRSESNEGIVSGESYDESKSLAKLAESMLVQRGKSQSNFEGLGGENTSKKDSNETQSTIDLLKNLDD